MTYRRRNGGRRARIVVRCGVALIVSGGCAPDATPQPTVFIAATPLPTPITTDYQLSATAWYAGLVIHLDAAASVIDEGGGSVDVHLRLENPGPDPASLGVPILLADGSQTVEPVRGTLIPDVPAGSSVDATIQFDVDGSFDVASAAVRIGRVSEHVVVVPLTAGVQERVTLEPVTLPLAGTATAGSLTVTLTSGELRADIPDWGIELSRDTLALTVKYSARYLGTFTGGFAFTGANLGLRLPDGSVVSSRADGHSQSVVVLKPASTVSDLLARYEIPAPGEGTYALIIRDGSRESSIPFTIEPRAAGG